MKIQTDASSVSWQDVADLFQAVGWGIRRAEDVQAAFGRGTFVAFAFEGSTLIGFGRTIDDGRYYARVVDVVVAPAHQRKGVGRAIVDSLQGRLAGFLVVSLTAAPDVQPFYRKLGWRRQTTAMMLPRSEEQARLNCTDD